MIRDHYLGVKALLPEGSGFGIHLGSVQEPVTYPYVVLWGDLGSETTDAMVNDPDTLDLRIRATYVSVGFDQLMWVADKVRSSLNRKIPIIPGWLPGRLNQMSLTDGQTDFDVTFNGGSHPMFAVDEFLLSSQRA